jgi:Phage Mu protein F like protein
MSAVALLTELTEKLGRPGLLGLAGRRIEKRCRAELKAYFTHLVREIIGLHLERLVEHATKETAKHSVEISVANVLRHRTPLLKAILESNIAEAMLKADKIHHFAEADDLSDEPDVEPFPAMLSGDEAALYASVRAGELVSGINDTTQQLIASAVETGIEDSLGVDGTARLIRQVADAMTVRRSQMIASTEMNDAFSEAALRKLNRLGIEWKQWITATACCDECADNEDASPIPIDEDFPSGDPRPPAHPNCRCAVTGARAPEAA